MGPPTPFFARSYVLGNQNTSKLAVAQHTVAKPMVGIMINSTDGKELFHYSCACAEYLWYS